MMAVVIDADGRILRCLSGAPAMFALQVRPGETLMQIVDGDGGLICDDQLRVSDTGNFERLAEAPAEAPLPSGELFYVPTRG